MIEEVKKRRDAVEILRSAYEEALRNEEGQNFWHLVTGLRGPDDERSTTKRSTTEVLRYHLFNEIIQRKRSKSPVETGGFLRSGDSKELLTERLSLSSSHFKGHMQNAFDAAGLKWDEVNVPPESEKETKCPKTES